ncbi:MAG TPA: nickel-dependent hydrogenase large subunit, partial [Sumerlaeia bacterium]|nr:nickel-dependent hydrogenase large subunit [Sumerlaeia bacterium]
GETLQSHILHVGYLALPDLVGTGSALPLETTHKDALHTVVRLHRLGNDICTVVGGRTTHPVRVQVGGFSALPTPGELVRLLVGLEGAIGEMEAIARVLQSLADRIPAFERDTEYVALASDAEYAFYDGLIASTDTGLHPVADYESVANEYIVPWSTAKWTRHNRSSYMVGALARANISGDRLSETAKRTAGELGFSTPCRNPFMNSVAQVVECVQSIEESVKIIGRLLERGITREESHVGVQAGRGVAAVEAPRGILFHDYTFDETGRCAKANCVIPTNQNHANIQGDFEAFAPTIANQPRKKVELLLQMLVRAYDPCVSCSTH